MSNDEIEWIPIDAGDVGIGAVGFINDQAAVVVAFYDDLDYHHEGRVTLNDRMWHLVGSFLPAPSPPSSIAQVMAAASLNGMILGKDPSLVQYGTITGGTTRSPGSPTRPMRCISAAPLRAWPVRSRRASAPISSPNSLFGRVWKQP